VAGIVFGVLALIRIAPITLMAMGMMAFWATLLLTTGWARLKRRVAMSFARFPG
jgi:hypothetical protein